jgi:2-dehydro-3-deoxygluconokinase
VPGQPKDDVVRSDSRRAAGELDTVPAVDLATLGETMAAFVRVELPDRYRLTTAGAESNVATGMAQLGCRTQWWSRLGEDELGEFVRDSLAGHGVEVSVDWDADRPTASCVKELGPTGSRMRYYRTRSAASRLDLLDVAPLVGAARLHLTGVTPALSPGDREVVELLFRERGAVGGTSFDVNYRPTLWAHDAEHAASVLVPLARMADVIFVGDDEAQALVGSADADVLADALLTRDGQELVIKRGAGEATLVTPGMRVSVPANRADVVDVTGAGDAFAAGYLAASAWGWDPHGRLQLGHFLASRVVAVTGDTGPPVHPAELARVADSVGQAVPQRREGARR